MIYTMKTRFVLVPSAATSGSVADVRLQDSNAVFGASNAWSPPV